MRRGEVSVSSADRPVEVNGAEHEKHAKSAGAPAGGMGADWPAARLGSLEEVYAQNAANMTTLAYLVSGQESAADDIWQEAFLRMARRGKQIRKPEALVSYMRQAVISVARDRWRSARRERSLLSDLASELHSPGSETGDSAVANDILWEGLDALPFRQRSALVLRYFDAWSEAEAAQALGCSSRAVNSLTSRGLAGLREHLRTHVAESGGTGGTNEEGSKSAN